MFRALAIASLLATSTSLRPGIARSGPRALHGLAPARMSAVGAGGKGGRGIPPEDSPERLKARLAMLGSALMFGSYAPAVKEVYLLPGPPTAAALSCARALLIALPLLPKLFESRADGEPTLDRRCLLAAAELSLYSFSLTALLNVGLAEGGSATKAAFLLQASVIFTPCLSIASGEPVERKTWLGAVMALAGVALIALDEVGGLAAAAANPELFRLEPSDVLFVGSAVAWALTIFRMGRFAQFEALADRVVPMQAAKNLILAFAFSGWLGWEMLRTGSGFLEQWPGVASPLMLLTVAASAMFGGLLGDLLQALGGKAMPSAEANVILTSEPLWAAGLTALLLDERLGPWVYVGGLLLISAGVVATVGFPLWVPEDAGAAAEGEAAAENAVEPRDLDASHCEGSEKPSGRAPSDADVAVETDRRDRAADTAQGDDTGDRLGRDQAADTHESHSSRTR
jgi:drug/metabolite transporter (DMT)-like permease